MKMILLFAGTAAAAVAAGVMLRKNKHNEQPRGIGCILVDEPEGYLTRGKATSLCSQMISQNELTEVEGTTDSSGLISELRSESAPGVSLSDAVELGSATGSADLTSEPSLEVDTGESSSDGVELASAAYSVDAITELSLEGDTGESSSDGVELASAANSAHVITEPTLEGDMGESSSGTSGQRLTYRQSCRIFVGGLTWTTSKTMLDEAFGQFGEIVQSEIRKDNEGRSRGFGFVSYRNEESVDRAIREMDGVKLDGRKIGVTRAHRNSKGSGRNQPARKVFGSRGGNAGQPLHAHGWEAPHIWSRPYC